MLVKVYDGPDPDPGRSLQTLPGIKIFVITSF